MERWEIQSLGIDSDTTNLYPSYLMPNNSKSEPSAWESRS